MFYLTNRHFGLHKTSTTNSFGIDLLVNFDLETYTYDISYFLALVL